MNARRTASSLTISLMLLGKHCELERHLLNNITHASLPHSQSLYDNEQQIQDHFARFWGTVAYHFSSNPYILGYELLNEPWAGDIYRHPNQLEPREKISYRMKNLWGHPSISRYFRPKESYANVQKTAFCYQRK